MRCWLRRPEPDCVWCGHAVEAYAARTWADARSASGRASSAKGSTSEGGLAGGGARGGVDDALAVEVRAAAAVCSCAMYSRRTMRLPIVPLRPEIAALHPGRAAVLLAGHRGVT